AVGVGQPAGHGEQVARERDTRDVAVDGGRAERGNRLAVIAEAVVAHTGGVEARQGERALAGESGLAADEDAAVALDGDRLTAVGAAGHEGACDATGSEGPERAGPAALRPEHLAVG